MHIICIHSSTNEWIMWPMPTDDAYSVSVISLTSHLGGRACRIRSSLPSVPAASRTRMNGQESHLTLISPAELSCCEMSVIWQYCHLTADSTVVVWVSGEGDGCFHIHWATYWIHIGSQANVVTLYSWPTCCGNAYIWLHWNQPPTCPFCPHLD